MYCPLKEYQLWLYPVDDIVAQDQISYKNSQDVKARQSDQDITNLCLEMLAYFLGVLVGLESRFLKSSCCLS